jgi:serine protease Do
MHIAVPQIPPSSPAFASEFPCFRRPKNRAFLTYSCHGKAPMSSPESPRRWSCLTAILLIALVTGPDGQAARASELRRTPIVKAVEKARPSVVNIRGHKTVRAERTASGASAPREVNGMGTGVVIDSRGYIITNYHVVEGVRQIVVTLHDQSSHTARLVSFDAKTDLAVIKIDQAESLRVITIGTSSDLMIGEPVIAVGNAYGYEHTVTRGIISALGRSVQISDAQHYHDLIQTDASINPGNSGGPLLNIDGEMIGLNVAVRAGAQGIGFAIPVDQAMTVAARLMSIEKLDRTWHGIVLRSTSAASSEGIAVERVAEGSPAAGSLRPGDVLKKVGGQSISRPLDLECSLLGRPVGQPVDVLVERDQRPVTLQLALAPLPGATADDRIWEQLGLRLLPIDPNHHREQLGRYRGGLRVSAVRQEGTAARQGIRTGDILVGMHIWETISLENVEFILNRPDFSQIAPLKFYILRDGETLVGRLPVTNR